MQRITTFLSDSYNGLTLTATGALTGTAAEQIQIFGFKASTMFQYSVWVLTIIVALLTIIGWCQKQVDRRKRKKKENV